MISTRALEAGRAVIRLSLNSSGLGGDLDKLRTRFSRLGAALSVSLFGSALAWPVKLAANLEEAQAEFTALTGSADTAKRMIDELQEFSRVSIVPVEQLQQAATGLLGYGVAAEDVVPALKALTEISRGSADRLQRLGLAFGQVSAKQRLYAQEVRQFVEAGFNPLAAIAERTGESMKAVQARMEAGGVSAAEVANALQSAVAPGGRFFGLLATISKTAVGQFRKLGTAIVLAVRPLGQTVLPTVTRFLEILNGLMPTIGSFLKAHERWYQLALAVGSASVVAAVGFITFGLSMQVLGTAAAGVAVAFGLVKALIAAALSPVVALGAGVIYLAKLFLTATETGRAMAAGWADYFGQLLTIATQAFRGIADALAGGSIAAASEVLWAALSLGWQVGTNDLETLWIELKFAVLGVMTDLVFGVQSLWTDLVASLKTVWSEFTGWFADAWDVIVHALAGIGETDAVKKQLEADLVAKVQARMGDRAADQQQIEAERQAAQAALEQAQRIAAEARRRGEADQLGAAQQELFEAQNRLNEALRAAKKIREEAEKNGLKGGPIPKLDLPGLETVADKVKPEAVLGNKQFLAQISGSDSAREEERRLLAAIEKNTRPDGGGLAVA